MVKPGWLLVPDDEGLCPTFCRSLEDLGRYISAVNKEDASHGFRVIPACIYERGMRGVDDATA